jgi:peptide chain release factor 1
MRELIYQVTRKDFRIDYFSGTGAGGQYRNKHQNCVRLTHNETGIVTTGQEQRSREQNLRDAAGSN